MAKLKSGYWCPLCSKRGDRKGLGSFQSFSREGQGWGRQAPGLIRETKVQLEQLLEVRAVLREVKGATEQGDPVGWGSQGRFSGGSGVLVEN